MLSKFFFDSHTLTSLKNYSTLVFANHGAPLCIITLHLSLPTTVRHFVFLDYTCLVYHFNPLFFAYYCAPLCNSDNGNLRPADVKFSMSTLELISIVFRQKSTISDP